MDRLFSFQPIFLFPVPKQSLTAKTCYVLTMWMENLMKTLCPWPNKNSSKSTTLSQIENCDQSAQSVTIHECPYISDEKAEVLRDDKNLTLMTTQPSST